MNICNTFVLVLLLQNTRTIDLPYTVQWQDTSTNVTAPQKNTIYCFRRASKTIEKLWWTLEIYIKIKNGTFHLYTGVTPEEVFDEYKNAWFKQDSKTATVNVNPFDTNCVLVDTTGKYQVQVLLKNVDQWRVAIMAAGIIVIFASKFLSRNPLCFYIGASIFGVLAMALALVYFISKRSITQTITTTMLIAGWSGVTYFFRQFWIFQIDDKYMQRYIIITGFVSFLVAYRIGPPTNPRSKNIMMWAIQAVGVVMILWSTWYEEASSAIVVISLAATYVFYCLLKSLQRRSGCQIMNLC